MLRKLGAANWVLTCGRVTDRYEFSAFSMDHESTCIAIGVLWVMGLGRCVHRQSFLDSGNDSKKKEPP